jgi:hypothetical protein
VDSGESDPGDRPSFNGSVCSVLILRGVMKSAVWHMHKENQDTQYVLAGGVA